MINPVTLLFDKSFLQSLTVDESVWLDAFFMTNICPYFYVETLADLNKERCKDGAKAEVKKIAMKFPDKNSYPNIFHITLCVNELLGHGVSMKGQVITYPARKFNNNGEVGFASDSSPENEAFLRWQEGKYLEIEQEQAKNWRSLVNSLDLNSMAKSFEVFKIQEKVCKTLEDCYELASMVVHSEDCKFDRMKLALDFLQVNDSLRYKIMERWRIYNYKNLKSYAPYLIFVLKIELFFQIAIINRIIAPERNSNRLDISYLFYLPFVKIFVSSDKQQLKWGKFFLTEDQEVINGNDLKKDLGALNEFYKKTISEEEAEKGILSIVDGPPENREFLVTRLWDKYYPGWKKSLGSNKIQKSNEPLERISQNTKKLLEQMDDSSIDTLEEFDPEKHTHIYTRNVRRKRGSWYQVDKRVPPRQQQD